MKKAAKIILAVCLTVLLAMGIGGYAYISDYCHADETAVEAMVGQADSVRIEHTAYAMVMVFVQHIIFTP